MRRGILTPDALRSRLVALLPKACASWGRSKSHECSDATDKVGVRPFTAQAQTLRRSLRYWRNCVCSLTGIWVQGATCQYSRCKVAAKAADQNRCRGSDRAICRRCWSPSGHGSAADGCNRHVGPAQVGGRGRQTYSAQPAGRRHSSGYFWSRSGRDQYGRQYRHPLQIQVLGQGEGE